MFLQAAALMIRAFWFMECFVRLVCWVEVANDEMLQLSR